MTNIKAQISQTGALQLQLTDTDCHKSGELEPYTLIFYRIGTL